MAIVHFIFLADRGNYSALTPASSWDASITGTGESVGAVGTLSFIESFTIGDVETSPSTQCLPLGWTMKVLTLTLLP